MSDGLSPASWIACTQASSVSSSTPRVTWRPTSDWPMPEMMQRFSNPSGIAMRPEHGCVRATLLAELDLHGHIDRDRVGLAADDVRHQSEVGLLVQRHDRDHIGNLSVRRPLAAV